MTTPDEPYHPIACSLHDQLEAAATRRKKVDLTYATPEGSVRVTGTRIVDIGTHGGAEYIRLGTGVEVRLDHIIEIDGTEFTRPQR